MILVVDNYDSFTYNLVQYVGMCGEVCQVVRNDQIDVSGIAAAKPDGILLSPGPCTPTESGVCVDLLRSALDPAGILSGIPLFGVCLGHQTMGYVSGGTVERAKIIMHGKSSLVSHDSKGLLTGMPNPFRAIRYHSLIVEESSIPQDFVATSRSLDDNEVMGMRHVSLPIEGVQFHPESVLTEEGITIVRNFVQLTRARPRTL